MLGMNLTPVYPTAILSDKIKGKTRRKKVLYCNNKMLIFKNISFSTSK